LLELLNDRGGVEDLSRLAEELVMDVEDLLPIVEASSLLGLVRLTEGEVKITPQGWRLPTLTSRPAKSSSGTRP
jgi:NitT/TauT family transport system ATP-binding protein